MNRYSIAKLGPHDWRVIDRTTTVPGEVFASKYHTRDEARAEARRLNARVVLGEEQAAVAA